MQQFARVRQGNRAIPALVSGNGLLDLRPVVTDITPETIASGALNKVQAAVLKPLEGEVRYLAPITGIQQNPATGFNYKKHIQEMQVPTPTELVPKIRADMACIFKCAAGTEFRRVRA
jgi:2,4-didehydro-3-deoxy-L-rhamnonate hydrolase